VERNLSIECNRCLLSNDIPGVKINDDGVCSVCRGWDAEWGNWESKKGERAATLKSLFINCHRRNRTYDVLVPFSGGRDSSYVLYYCRKFFNLRCLAVTFDNGFLTNHAKDNIKHITDLLGVDHVYYRINWSLMKQFYRFFFLKTGFFCPVCMRGIDVSVQKAARTFNIPIVVWGTSKRTEGLIPRGYNVHGDINFFKKVIKNTSLEKDAKPLLYDDFIRQRVRWSLFPRLKNEKLFCNRLFCCFDINLPDYIDWNYDEIYETLQRELSWKSHKEEAEHTDCKANDIVHYIRRRQFPALDIEKLRYSKLVTAGILSKQEANEKIAHASHERAEPSDLVDFLEIIEISREQFETVVNDPYRYIKFLPRYVLPEDRTQANNM
jgi:hypothetical protein